MVDLIFPRFDNFKLFLNCCSGLLIINSFIFKIRLFTVSVGLSFQFVDP